MVASIVLNVFFPLHAHIALSILLPSHVQCLWAWMRTLNEWLPVVLNHNATWPLSNKPWMHVIWFAVRCARWFRPINPLLDLWLFYVCLDCDHYKLGSLHLVAIKYAPSWLSFTTHRKLSISNEQFITLLRSRDEPVEKGIILEVCTLFLQRFIRRAQESDGLLIESFRWFIKNNHYGAYLIAATCREPSL